MDIKDKMWLISLLKELRFSAAGVSNNADIDVPPQIDSLVRFLVDTAKQHE